MPILSERTLHTRTEMVRVLMRAGQFAHLGEADFNRSLDSLWNIDERLTWISDGATSYHPSTWAERAVSIALLKAAETGLIPKDYFDAQTIDFVARTEPTLCCLCHSISDTFKGVYDISLGFAVYACPTFYALDVPYYVRRPFCGACSWAISARIKQERDNPQPIPHGEYLWGAVLAWIVASPKFRERASENFGNRSRLRFDPRRAHETSFVSDGC